MIRKLRGVFYGWWIVILCFILHMTCGGIAAYGFTAFFNPILTEMGWTRAETSLAFSLRSVEGGIMMPIIGLFIDRLGVRKCIVVGLMLQSVSLFLLSRLSSLPSFYVGFFLLAFAQTLGFGLAEQTAVVNWFRRYRSLAMGVLTAGYGASGIIAPLLVLMIHAYGWRDTLAILVPINLAIGLPIAMMVRHRPEPYGLLPDGDKVADPAPAIKNSGTAASEKQDAYSRSSAVVTTELTVRECMATKTFWLLMLFAMFMGFAPSAIMVHIMPALISVDIPENIAALTVTAMTMCSVMGRLGFSWLADIYGKKRILIIAVVMEALGILIFANIRATWMIIPFAILYGPGFGATVPLLPALQADCFGTKTFATLRGIMMMGHVIPGVIAPYVAGLIYDLKSSYRMPFTLFAILCCFAVPVMMVIPLPRVQGRTGAVGKAAR